MIHPGRRALHSITAKSIFCFTFLAVLLLIEGGINYATITAMRQASSDMTFSTEIRLNIFEMDGELEKARRLHRDFFIRYPEIGFSQAISQYFTPSQEVIGRVVRMSEELRSSLVRMPDAHPLKKRMSDINLYLSSAQRFADTFSGLVELVNRLADPDGGLQSRMEGCKNALREYARRHPESLLIYEQMISDEQRYWLTRQRSNLQAAMNEAANLEIYFKSASSGMSPAQMQSVHGRIAVYEQLAREVFEVDQGIQSRFNDFALQARSVDPISQGLKATAAKVVHEAQIRINEATRRAFLIMVAMALTGLVAVAVVGYCIHAFITRRVVSLTLVAGELRKGNLHLRAPVGTRRDEIDDLTLAINDMAAQLQRLVDHLEEAVQARTSELTQARDELEVAVRMLDERNSMLEVLSRTDRLTGLPNRRKLEEFLHAEILRARRYNAPFCVIMLDIDHFKNVNDTYGHQIGDIVLVAIAERMTHNARETDLVGRWGGEEFLLVCPQTLLEVGLSIAERLRRDMERSPIANVGSVTASFGVSVYASEDDQFSLLQRVDEALYKAKSNGRNRVEYEVKQVDQEGRHESPYKDTEGKAR